MEKIIERLKKKGVVLTPQRLAVAEFVEENWTHPTVDEIYNRLKKKYPTMSQATVYTSLEALRKAGEIQELTIRKEKVCFDSNINPHHHFFCLECREVMDIDISCSVAEKGWVNGNKVQGIQACFYGVCSSCLKKDTGEKYEQKKKKYHQN